MNGIRTRQNAIGPTATSMNGRRRPSGVWKVSLHGPITGERSSAKTPSARSTRAISVPELVKWPSSTGRKVSVVIEKARPKAPSPSTHTSRPPASCGRGGATSSWTLIRSRSHYFRARPGKSERRRQRVQVGEPAFELRIAVLSVDEEGAHSERPRAVDVVLGRVADHRRLLRCHAEPLERRAEDRLVRLRPAVRARAHSRVDVEPVVDDERIEVASAVRDEPDLQADAPQLVEHGKRVLVEVEVAVLLPRALDRDRAVVGQLARAAHAADDALRKRDPDLLVVLELGMSFERLHGGRASLLVARRVEPQAELLAAAAISLRPQFRPRLRQREVDVEEDG